MMGLAELAEAYSSAASVLAGIADQLAGNPDDPEAIAMALRETVAVLDQLVGIEPDAQTRAGLQQLGADLNKAGTIAPDKMREIARACYDIAQNYRAQLAQWNNIWT